MKSAVFEVAIGFAGMLLWVWAMVQAFAGAS